ncbi:helix-turn-helix domain-containing protein [soil metagenome]
MTEVLPRGGSQTLARGITALKLVVAAPEGLTVHELAEALDVHRTIASRLLATLADAALVSKGRDGRYRGAFGLLMLAGGAYSALRDAAMPHLRKLADSLGATVSLLVADAGEAVAVSVVTARDARYKIVFSEGSTHPLDRGAASYALLSLREPSPADSEKVIETRARGYATSFSEVEPNAFGLAVPLALSTGAEACLNIISYQPDVIETSIAPMLAAARELVRAL